jgi:ABC-type Fe3+/spermidine/putrescine transport system ATPase subunit
VSLRAQSIVKTYPEFRLEASFAVEPGEILVLAGPSGCGKSTLLQLVLGLLPAEGGRIFLDGVDIGALPAWRRRLGLVFQDLALFPHLSVGGNVAFGPAAAGKNRAARRMLVEDSLRLVRLEGYGHRRVSTLSGGERQRVAIARALAAEPRALLLDEPFSSLDAPLRLELRRSVRELVAATGLPCLFVTHDREEAAMVGDRIAVMRDGRIVESGGAARIFTAPSKVFTAEFLGLGAVVDRNGDFGRECSERLGLAGGTWLIPAEAVSAERASGNAGTAAPETAPASARPRWPAKAVGAVFSGEAWDLALEMADGTRLSARLERRSEPVRIGEAWTVSLEPALISPLEGST